MIRLFKINSTYSLWVLKEKKTTIWNFVEQWNNVIGEMDHLVARQLYIQCVKVNRIAWALRKMVYID